MKVIKNGEKNPEKIRGMRKPRKRKNVGIVRAAPTSWVTQPRETETVGLKKEALSVSYFFFPALAFLVTVKCDDGVGRTFL